MALPYSLAHPLEQFQTHRQAGSWSKAANYMLDFLEVSSQYVSIVLLGKIRDHVLAGASPDEACVKVVSKIDAKRPLSFGDWCNDILPVVMQSASATLPDDPVVKGISAVINRKRNIFLGSKGEQSMVQVRNEYKGHSTTLSEAIYKDIVESLLPRLGTWAEALQALEDYDGEASLYPLIHTDEQGHVYVFQSLKEESVSFISADEDALTYIGERYNKDFDAWMQVLVPSFDISKDLNWDEYVALMHGLCDRYMKRIYAQKKYNRELFVERDALSAGFSAFVNSGKSIFPLLGEAGQGKTNQLCHWTETLQEAGEAVMIFSGSDFAEMTLSDQLRESFGISRRKQITRLTEPLQKLAAEQDRKVYVFFDAVNECIAYPGITDDTDGPLMLFREICEVFGKPGYTNFRVLFTCRNYTWHQRLAPELSRMDSSMFFNRGTEDEMSVRGFSDSEVEKAYGIYGELYQMATGFGELERSCVLRLKDPLLLKIACTNYLGKELPTDNAQYCSIAMWRRMMQDIASSYAGRRQKETIAEMSRILLERYESGTPADSLLMSELRRAYSCPDDPQHGIASLIFKKDGTTIAFGELLNKPERPILRLIDGEKIQFIYERFLEYQMARAYYEREAAALPEGANIAAETIVGTIRKAAMNEVFMETMSCVLTMDYANTGNPETLIRLIQEFGDDFTVLTLVTDVMNTLVAENYEEKLFSLERTLMTSMDPATAALVKEYNEVCRKIGANKADSEVIARHKVLSASLTPFIRMRELASSTLINGVFLTDYCNEDLYREDPYRLFELLIDESISEVRDNTCMLVYYLFNKTHTSSYSPLKENVTERIVRRMLSSVTKNPLMKTVAVKKVRDRAVAILESGVRLNVLMIIDMLLGGRKEDRERISGLLDEITDIFSYFTLKFRLVKMLMPFFDWIMRRQFTFQSAYVNNVIEYQTFWDDNVVPVQGSADRWGRDDFRALAPFIGYYSDYFSPDATASPADAPDFGPMAERVLRAYQTGDSLSYFALERIMVIIAVADWDAVQPLMEQLRYGSLRQTEYFDYTQMSIIYTLYQMGMKMPQMPDFVWEMLEEWCVDWTRRCRGYFKGRNSFKANPLQLYKRNVMTWYAMVYAHRHGDAEDETGKSVPAFRALISEAILNRDKELLVHLINNISELVSDSGYINTALDLLKQVLSGIDSQAVLDSFEANASSRYPDTSESIVALVGKVLGTAKNYFPREVNRFMKKDAQALTFPGLAGYRDEILGFNPGGEKLSDLFTHKFGNFVIWSLINEKAVNEVAGEVLDAAAAAPDSIKWFDRTIRIVFRRMFKIKI